MLGTLTTEWILLTIIQTNNQLWMNTLMEPHKKTLQPPKKLTMRHIMKIRLRQLQFRAHTEDQNLAMTLLIMIMMVKNIIHYQVLGFMQMENIIKLINSII